MVVFFVLLLSLLANVSGQKPKFRVKSENVTVIVGDTAVLPCHVDNITSHHVLWIDPRDVILTFNDYQIIDSDLMRLRRPTARDWNLHVHNAQTSHNGKYQCQVNTVPPMSKTVFLRVVESEAVQILVEKSSASEVEAGEGERVELMCQVSGIPIPTVTWFRGHNHTDIQTQKKLDQTGQLLVLQNVSRNDSDLYTCVADNNVSSAVQHTITLRVLYLPEVILQTPKLKQRRGKSAMLVCVVPTSIEPYPVLGWRRHGHIMTNDSTQLIKTVTKPGQVMLLLTIHSLTQDDFGEYQCVAENAVGQDSKTAILSEHLDKLEQDHTTPLTTTQNTTERKNELHNVIISRAVTWSSGASSVIVLVHGALIAMFFITG